uniref:Calphotin-like protein n=1 Tax=Trypanosoma vivax (strain Y486) TaxID=1055687 RepID=G0U797_TRYVY|nr:conserved hypothetical protein [Trypanosoma vivax Y486]
MMNNPLPVPPPIAVMAAPPVATPPKLQEVTPTVQVLSVPIPIPSGNAPQPVVAPAALQVPLSISPSVTSALPVQASSIVSTTLLARVEPPVNTDPPECTTLTDGACTQSSTEASSSSNLTSANVTPVQYAVPASALQQQRVVSSDDVKAPDTARASESSPADFQQPSRPSFIVFGGVRYDCEPSAQKAKHSIGPRVGGQCHKFTNWSSVSHISEQLKLASTFLPFCSQRLPKPLPQSRTPTRPNPSSSSGITRTEDGVFAQNICTLAYAGSSRSLRAAIEGLDDNFLNAKGYVVYNRRQYGIKRCSERYVLGLGHKASALQFAAISGQLDKVALLLHFGSRDDSKPFLKDIIGPEAAAALTGARMKSRREQHAAGSSVGEATVEVDALPKLTAQEELPSNPV